MAQTLDIAGAGTVGMAGNGTPFGLFKNLERPGDVFRDLGPNWFASVMGTGIVANASAVLPLQVPGLRGFATAVWALAAALLVTLTGAWAIHWTRYNERARAHASNPVMAQFWGAPAMALMTVAARCHADVLRGASVFLFGLLLVAWVVVASRTVSGVVTGRLFPAAISRALSV